MRFLISRAAAWAAALAILPACWAVTAAFAGMIPPVFLLPSGSARGWFLVPEGWAFAGGAGAYALWHRIRPPEFLYTFAHEITHLLFALIFGKKVSRLVVSRESGQVAMSGTNFLITLAPYFFPLLAALILAAGAVAEWGFGDGRFRPLVSFLMGLALAFHVTMTLQTLATSQSDIDRGGRLFSWSVIYLIGVVFTGGAALAAAGGGGVLWPFSGNILLEGRYAYAWSAEWVLEFVQIGMAWAVGR